MRKLSIIVLSTALIGGAWGGYYAYEKGFTKKWRRFINEEFEKRGIEAEIGRLTLDPFRGLVARDVKFFQDPERDVLLAEVTRIVLDIDFANLVRQEDFLTTVDVKNADLSLPLDPENPESDRLVIDNVSARVLLPPDRIEIPYAQADFYGIQFNIRGHLLRKPPDPDENPEEKKERREKEAEARLEMLERHRESIRTVVATIEALSFPEGAAAPVIDLEVTGNLEDLATLRARAELNATDVTYKTFTANQIRAAIEYDEGTLALKDLIVSDDHGQLTGFAHLDNDAGTVPFSLESTIDVHALVSAVLPTPELGEVVFYDPPKLSLDGQVLLPDRPTDDPVPPEGEGEGATPKFTFDVVGRFACGKVVSRGVVFEGVSLDFSRAASRVYLRNVRLDHQSGTATLQSLYERGTGVRWKAKIDLDPSVFSPFVRSDGLRSLLSKIGMDADSSLQIDAEGTGPKSDPKTWKTVASIEASDFSFNGVAIDTLKTGFEAEGRLQTYRDFVMTRADGSASGKLATYQLDTRHLVIEEGTSTSDPATLASLFSPKVAEAIRRYRYSVPPKVTVRGTIDALTGEHTDLRADFVSPEDGQFRYELLGEDLAFSEVRGRLHLHGHGVGLSLGGRLASGEGMFGATLHKGADVTASGWFQKDQSPAVDLDIDIVSRGLIIQELFGKEVPITGARISCKVIDQTMDLEVDGHLFGGSLRAEAGFGGIGSSPEDPPATYQANIGINDVPFKSLADIYSENDETEGNLDAHFAFQGELGDPYSVTGRGSATIVRGNLYSIPLFGPLSKLVSLAMPESGVGYSVAREATATFRVGSGVIRCEDFEALTPAFRLKSSGIIDYRHDRLDLRARLNARGAPGIILFPVSKLFEYKADGTLADPNWRSAALGGLGATSPPPN
ncbi:hypothetical protein BH23VER1_BH23VER1_32170 [soil metagenome]